MSVLIKGMDMPKTCSQCQLRTIVPHYGFCCSALHRQVSSDYYFIEPDCPLVEVPTPHGRLIDADDLPLREINNANYPSNYIKLAPTIIEAEVSE